MEGGTEERMTDIEITRGIFLERVNRFVTRVEVNGGVWNAYLPNPGRLWELLLPGREVILVPNLRGKFPFTLVAIFKDRYPVLLHTHWTNRYVKGLLLEGTISELEGYRILAEEPRVKGGRLDFLMEGRMGKMFLEVKTCTLFCGRTAMFPDAITLRGRRHLYELQELKEEGYEVLCLFVVMSPEVRYFLPAYHVDPHFTKAFIRTFERVKLLALAVDLSPDLSSLRVERSLVIPMKFLKREVRGEPIYVTLVKDSKGDLPISPGEGYYLILHRGDGPSLPFSPLRTVRIVSTEDLKNPLEGDLEGVADRVYPWSDPHQKAQEERKLFFFRDDPFRKENFVRILEHYLLERPGQRIEEEEGE
jgi:sugar fermentation stimulation protein A